MNPRILLLALAGRGVVGCCEPKENPTDDTIHIWHPRAAIRETCESELEDEPNDDVVSASVVGHIAECEERALPLAVAADSDVLYVWGDRCDDSHPRASLEGPGAGFRLCLFVACSDGKTGFDSEHPCPQGEPYQTLEGVLGCCSKDDENAVEVNMNCDADFVFTGSAHGVDAYVALDQRDATTCEQRSVKVRL